MGAQGDSTCQQLPLQPLQVGSVLGPQMSLEGPSALESQPESFISERDKGFHHRRDGTQTIVACQLTCPHLQGHLTSVLFSLAPCGPQRCSRSGG